MKQCRYCHKYYDKLDFGVAKTTEKKVYRRWKCRDCYRETKAKLMNKYRKLIDDHKKKEGCKNCGIRDYRVLDFHHIRDKEFTIADFRRHHYNKDRLIKEIEKCIVICANCHRLTHFEERQKKAKLRGVA